MRPPARDIAQVRSFNRLVTRQVGALQDRYLDRRPLGEARVLFEIGARGATARDVRAKYELRSPDGTTTLIQLFHAGTQ